MCLKIRYDRESEKFCKIFWKQNKALDPRLLTRRSLIALGFRKSGGSGITHFSVPLSLSSFLTNPGSSWSHDVIYRLCMVNINITGIHHVLYLSWLRLHQIDTSALSKRYIWVANWFAGVVIFFFLFFSLSPYQTSHSKDWISAPIPCMTTTISDHITLRFARSMHGVKLLWDSPPFHFRKYLRQQLIYCFRRKWKKHKKIS
jgi:hypothetical protein